MQNERGMVILLCDVRERVIIMQLEVNRISDEDEGGLIDVSLTMLTLRAISTNLTVRRTVLLHLQLQRIKKKHAVQLVLTKQCWK